MRVDEEGEYIDTVGRMSDIALRGRSGRVRVRGDSELSTITGISSTLSSCSSSTSVVVDCSSWAFPLPDRRLRAVAWLDDTADEAGDVWEDELELAMLVELSVAPESVKDLILSRPCLCRNLDNFEPCCGLGDDGCGGAPRDCLDIVVLAVVVVVVVGGGCVVVVTDDVDKAGIVSVWLVYITTRHSVHTTEICPRWAQYFIMYIQKSTIQSTLLVGGP